MATKKVKSAGRFGARYGKKVRAKITEIESLQRKKQKCPYCHRFRVKRLAPGLYHCKKCDTKYTGKAYTVS